VEGDTLRQSLVQHLFLDQVASHSASVICGVCALFSLLTEFNKLLPRTVVRTCNVVRPSDLVCERKAVKQAGEVSKLSSYSYSST